MSERSSYSMQFANLEIVQKSRDGFDMCEFRRFNKTSAIQF